MKRRNGPVRMRDLADYLGLSMATVSRALNHPERVAPDKLAQIEDAIAKLNYRPNLAARNLRSRESRTLLIVFPDLSPFFLDVFRGAEIAAEELGYTALMGHCERKDERELMFLEQALSGRADGVVLVVPSTGPKLANMSRLPPIVTMMEDVEGLALSNVGVNNFHGARLAMQHLIALGHTRIAHIAGTPGKMANQRIEGFRSMVAEAGLDPKLCYLVQGAYTVAAGEIAMERLLTRHPRPTAVFAANDEIAIGAMQVIKRAGLQIGKDISMVGFDDQRTASLYEPNLTTVDVPMIELGKEAVRLLVKVIQGKPSQDVELPTSMVVRQTTGAAPVVARAGLV